MPFQKAIVTAGPTLEWIDPVRYITNASSGKMGFSIATNLIKHIPNLVYIHGGVKEKYENVEGAKNLAVETTINLRDAILNELESNTLVVMAAAPADFKPKTSAEHKIKKTNQDEGLVIHLEQNPDVLASLNEFILKGQLENTKLIGFAAETENLEQNAIGKLNRKGLTYIVGNYVGKGSGFGEGSSTIQIFSQKGIEFELQNTPKEQIAREIVLFLLKNLN